MIAKIYVINKSYLGRIEQEKYINPINKWRKEMNRNFKKKKNSHGQKAQ